MDTSRITSECEGMSSLYLYYYSSSNHLVMNYKVRNKLEKAVDQDDINAEYLEAVLKESMRR